jgi:branched-chain amino acid transport system ATP-binding protein
MSLLRLDRVSRRYGRLTALDGISLEVEPHEIHAVIGPNGAGKTTLFHLITGFTSPSDGTIWFDNKRIDQLSVKQRIALGIIRTFQVTEIFRDLTVYENLRLAVETAAGWNPRPWLGRAARRRVHERVDALMETTGLGRLADRVAGELAHGDQRVVEVALALSLEPRLLLLDEPTAGMADRETDMMVTLLKRLRDRHALALLFVEHDMDIIFGIADRITVLDNGHLLAAGTADEIAANADVQAAYLGEAE